MLLVMLTIACNMSHNNTDNVPGTEEVITSVPALAEVAVIEFPEPLQPYDEIMDSVKALKVDMISSEYCLHDLTGDSVPELWIRSGSCEADKRMYVYIIKDDKAELLSVISCAEKKRYPSNDAEKGCLSSDTLRVNNKTKIDMGDIFESEILDPPNITQALPGYKLYHFSKNHFLSDSISSLHCEMNFAVIPNEPFWIKQFLNRFIKKEIESIFFEDNIKLKLFKIDPSTSWDEIGKYYFDLLKRNYTNKYNHNIKYGIFHMDDYEFKITIYPVWENNQFITFQIYVDENPGCMHNTEIDFCRTYEKSTGRLLGINDFYTKSEFEEIKVCLGKRLDIELDRVGMTPDVDYKDFQVSASSDTILKEKYDGRFFPRPAFLKEGIIFSYQTFEHGAPRAYGTMKFIIPYNKSL